MTILNLLHLLSPEIVWGIASTSINIILLAAVPRVPLPWPRMKYRCSPLLSVWCAWAPIESMAFVINRPQRCQLRSQSMQSIAVLQVWSNRRSLGCVNRDSQDVVSPNLWLYRPHLYMVTDDNELCSCIKCLYPGRSLVTESVTINGYHCTDVTRLWWWWFLVVSPKLPSFLFRSSWLLSFFIIPFLMDDGGTATFKIPEIDEDGDDWQKICGNICVACMENIWGV